MQELVKEVLDRLLQLFSSSTEEISQVVTEWRNLYDSLAIDELMEKLRKSHGKKVSTSASPLTFRNVDPSELTVAGRKAKILNAKVIIFCRVLLDQLFYNFIMTL